MTAQAAYVSHQSSWRDEGIVRQALEHPGELRAELALRRLRHFVRASWPVIEPGATYLENWHIDALCEHLEAVTNNQIKHLLVNVPPRTSKSGVISVNWPVWSWLDDPNAPAGSQRGAGLRFLFSSYAESLAIDLAVSSRRIIQSLWFQRYFGHHFKLTSDVNLKSQYENDARGYRISQGVDGSATGKGGDVLVFDDPHNVKKAESQTVLRNTGKWFDEVMRNRLNDERTGHRVVIMQRCAQGDISGRILERANADGFEHLNLPMEYEGRCIVDLVHRCSQPTGREVEIEHKSKKIKPPKLPPTSIGFKDPRRKRGELLHSSRFPPEVVASLKLMGDYAYDSQYQQRPGARKGDFFKVEGFDIWDELYEDEVVQRWRAWDKAATEGGTGPCTAGVRMGMMKFYASAKDEKLKKWTKLYFVDDVVRGRWGPSKREEVIKLTAGLDGKRVKISVEQEPGSGGKESADATKRMLAGYTVYLDNVSTEGSKEQRADPYSVAVGQGLVVLLAGDWNYDFVEEHRHFPRGTLKDQVDAAAQGYARLSRAVRVHIG